MFLMHILKAHSGKKETLKSNHKKLLQIPTVNFLLDFNMFFSSFVNLF